VPRLDKKIALITGGASGLGKAIARGVVAEGGKVVITDIQRELGEATAAEYGFTFFHQDVTDEAQWTDLVREVEKRFGQLDILVNNAGIAGANDAASPESTRLQDWRRVFAVNVESVFLGCRAAIAVMRRGAGGSIVNISSIAALRASPHATAYGASKAAVRHLTKSVAQYCAEQRLNIRCNSIHPGDVQTPLWDARIREIARARRIGVDQVIEEVKARIPTGELTLPEDVAAAVCFLASDDARRVTGEQLIVDGGVFNCESYRSSSRSESPAGLSSDRVSA
jgi:3(or 17)beta-hydroxysteroid dehydrogenase